MQLIVILYDFLNHDRNFSDLSPADTQVKCVNFYPLRYAINAGGLLKGIYKLILAIASHTDSQRFGT